MNPAEKIQAAIGKLQALRSASGQEAWTWERGNDLYVNVRSEQYGVRFTTGYVGNNDSRNDAELIVTLHRTIDAQLSILRWALSDHDDDVQHWADEGKPHLRTCLKISPIHIAAAALADAILGDSDA